MGPINYALDVQDPFQSALQGFQAGSQIRQIGIKQQAQEAEIAQQRAAMEQQARLQEAYQRVYASANPTAADFSSLMLMDPKSSEGIQRAWATRDTAQQRSHATDLLQWGAAIKSGRHELAADQMLQRVTALENSGAPEAEIQALRLQAQIVKEHPQFALGSIEAMLSVNPLGKDAAESLAKFGAERRATELQPGLVKKGEADASAAESDAVTKGVTAKYAESNALKDLETKGWNIQALQADIEFKKQSARIAAMNASLAKEGNALKRQELQLKIDEAVSTRESKLREKVAAAETGAAAIDNALNTVERIKKNRSLNSVVGSMEGSAYYPNTTLGTLNPFGDGDERADAIALIDTLKSQNFLAQIPAMKGTGALTDKEGDKLETSLINLRRDQSEGQFRANLDEAARLLKKGRDALAKGTGVPLGKPDTPAAPGSRPPLSSFEVSQSAQGGQRSQ